MTELTQYLINNQHILIDQLKPNIYWAPREQDVTMLRGILDSSLVQQTYLENLPRASAEDAKLNKNTILVIHPVGARMVTLSFTECL